jgi:4-carboxymuconolactone decarboxylase
VTRLPTITERALDDAQRMLWDNVVGGRRAQAHGGASELVDDDGGLIGPFNAWLQSPAVGIAAADLGAALRFDSSLDRRLLELAVVIVASHWRADFEFVAHTRYARDAGIDGALVDALARGERIEPRAEDERIVADLVYGRLHDGHVADTTAAAAIELCGRRGIVELVTLVGHYCTVSFVLNAFDVQAPRGTDPVWR